MLSAGYDVINASVEVFLYCKKNCLIVYVIKIWKSFLKAKYWEDRMVESNLQSLIFRNFFKITVVHGKLSLIWEFLGFGGFCLLLGIYLKKMKRKGTLHFPWDVSTSSKNKLNVMYDFCS